MTQKEKNRIDLLEEKVSDMEKNLERVLFYIENDPKTNQPGIVEKLDILNESVRNLIKREEIYKGKATVWGIVGSVVWSGIVAAFWFILKTLL